MIEGDESQEPETFLHMKTRTELESDLERCLERKQNLEEEKSALHNLRVDLEATLKQREEDLSNVRAELESVGSEKEKVEEELNQLKELRSDELEKIETLNQKILHIARERGELQEENRKLTESMKQIEQDRETYKAYSEEAERLIEVKTGKLMADLREIQQLNEQYRREIQEKEEKLRTYEEESQRVKEEREALEKEMQMQQVKKKVSEDFLVNLSDKLEDLQNLVNSFGMQLQEAIEAGVEVEGTEAERTKVERAEMEAEVEGTAEIEKEAEVETLLSEPEHIGETVSGEPGERVPEEIEETEQDVEPGGMEAEERVETGEMGLEMPSEPEQFEAAESEIGVTAESATERVTEQPREFEGELESTDKTEPDLPESKEKEKFPWEEEDEDSSWGF